MSRINLLLTNLSRSTVFIGSVQLIVAAALAVLVAVLLADENLLLVGALIALPVIVLVLHRYPFISIAIWLLLAPFLTHTTTPSERMVYWVIHRALPPATLIVIVLVSILKINKRRLPVLGFAELSMFGYVIASVLSIYILNANPLATLYLFYDRVISPMFLYLIVRFCVPDQKDIQRLLPIIFFIGVSQSVFGLLSWMAPGLLPEDWLGKAGERTTGSLVNTTVYTATLVFSGLILLHAALNQRSRVIRNLFLAAFVSTLVLVFLSFSRASWLGGIAVLIGVAILYPRFASSLATFILIIAMLFGALILARFSWVVDQANQRLHSEEAATSAFSRLPVFYAGFRMLLVKPVFGWGYGNFDLYDREFQAQIGPFVGDNKDHASHNSFITLLSEQGLLGFFLFMGPLFYWFNQTFRKGKRLSPVGFYSRKLTMLLWLSLLNQIILVNFSNLRVFFGWGIWWITLGLLASMLSSVPTQVEESSPNRDLKRINLGIY